MTIKATILEILNHPSVQMGCIRVTKEVMMRKGLDKHSIVDDYKGGVHDILEELVNKNLLRYADVKTPRGGKIYMRNQ